MSSTVRISATGRYQRRQVVEDEGLPAKFANNPYVYVHYPRGFSFDDVLGEFLPDLNEGHLVAGVNGVEEDPRNPKILKPQKMFAGTLAKGGIVINTDEDRLGEWKNYLASFDCKGGGKHYCFVAVEFDKLPGGEAIAREAPNQFREFRKYIRDHRLCHEMSEPVYNKLVGIEESALDRAIQRAQSNPHLGKKVEAIQARIAAMKKAWAKLNDAQQEAAQPVQKGPKAPPTIRVGPGGASEVQA